MPEIHDAITLDQLIERLSLVRDMIGGDAPVVLDRITNDELGNNPIFIPKNERYAIADAGVIVKQLHAIKEIDSTGQPIMFYTDSSKFAHDLINAHGAIGWERMGERTVVVLKS